MNIPLFGLTMHCQKKRLLTALASTLLLPNYLSAQESQAVHKPVIEEIFVTATKRSQSIQDVPLSISVIDSNFIADQAIGSIEDILLFTPNMAVETGSFFGGPKCRGFSLDNRNRGFEPPCGVAIDGIPYTTPEYFTAAVYDVKRVEVLRGPQGTTFGKNTTAGLVHVITQDPSGEFSGYLDVQYGELDRRRYEAAIGGPVIENIVNFRAAGLSEKRDGYYTNTTAEVVPEADSRPLAEDREAIRAKIEFPDIFRSSLKLKHENANFRINGLNGELFDVKPQVKNYLRNFDPNADFTRYNFKTSKNEPESLSVKIDTSQIDWSYAELPWSIDFVASRSTITYDVKADEVLPAPVFTKTEIFDENVASTAELRTLSPVFSGFFGIDSIFGLDLGDSDLLAGVFYQKRAINDSFNSLCANSQEFATFAAIASSPDEFAVVPIPPIDSSHSPEECFIILFDQDARTEAAFAEFKWNLSAIVSMQFGARISKEEKSATWDLNLTEDPSPLLMAAGMREFSEKKRRSEEQFQPKFALNYSPTEDINVFLRWTRGFKGGGYNAFVTRGEDDPGADGTFLPLEYDPEKAEEWSIDIKSMLLSQSLRLNVSLFRLTVEDFQFLAQFVDPTTGLVQTGTAVLNVGKARSQGVEADITYNPTTWLSLIGTIGYNDTEFIKFEDNTCPVGRPSTSDEPGRCDVSGESFPFSPKHNHTLTTQLNFPLSSIGLDSISFTAGATLEYFSDQVLTQSLDPLAHQSSFKRWRANVGLRSDIAGWSFKIVGTNLTDENSSSRINPLPTLGISQDFPDPPRTIFGQFRWAF